MSATDENTLVERVFLRIGSAETDEQLQMALTRFLPPVILKLDSKEEGVRKKVMELLVHVNKRLKSRTKVQLPVEDFMTHYQNTESSPIVTNFSMIYIKMGFPRLDGEKQGELVPTLIRCLDGRSANHQDGLLQLLVSALENVKFPSKKEEKMERFSFTENTKIVKLLLDYLLDVLILPYNCQLLHQELQKQRPASAPPGESAPDPTAPPGLSVESFKRVMGENPYTPESLEKAKLGILKFLGGDLFPEQDIVCHYIIGAADTRHSVATAADMELKRIMGSVDFNSSAILNKLFRIFLGTVDLKGQPKVKPEAKRKEACTRIRLKIFPYFLKARESGNATPFNILVIFDCLNGTNTNKKLKIMAIQFIHHITLNCDEAKFQQICPVLQNKMLELIKAGKEDPKILSVAYVAVGKCVYRCPSKVNTNIVFVLLFFHHLCTVKFGLMFDKGQKQSSTLSCDSSYSYLLGTRVGTRPQVDAETRLAVQEALSLMSSAFKDLNEENMMLMEATLMENIDKEEPQARMMAVQYAIRIFPQDHVPSRYILLLACGDAKEDIHIEASKGLKPKVRDDQVFPKPESSELEMMLPSFTEMVRYIRVKAEVRENSSQRYVIGNNVLPFNPVAFGEILLYLRTCLAHSAGLKPDMESLTSMKEQAPAISKYVQSLIREHNLETGPIQLYVELIRQLLKAVGGAPPMYCLLEVVAMAPDQLVPQFIEHLGWLKTLVYSMKDDIRDLAANLYAIIICNQPDEDKVLGALDDFYSGMSDKSPETQNGALFALGYLIGQLLHNQKTQESIKGSSLQQKTQKRIEAAVRAIASLIKVADERSPLLSSGACSAIGEIGRNGALPLPDGEGEAGDGEITKLSIVNNLLAIVRSGKENTKNKERAALCLGQLCVGEEKFPHRKAVIEGLLSSIQSKQLDLHFTIGEALVFAAQGSTSPVARNLWTETEEEFRARVSSMEDEVAWYLKTVLEQYVPNVNPHIRQASSIWLLAVVKKCSSHDALQSQLIQLQGAFMRLLSETDEITQDIASKGLALVYEICSSEQKDKLVSELVGTLMTGKKKTQEVTGDTQVFEEGSIGKTPEGGGLSTYKELCSIASDLNQPDLIYKFMHLASHNAMWNSRKGAAFGFSTIAAQAGEQLAPYLPQIVPRLYRYQFDPNPKIQQAMSSIWNALVQDNKNTVDKYMKEILADLLSNLTNVQWRVRESSCLAVNDLLRGRPLDDVVDSLPELWESCLRVRDDIKESVRNAADLACKTLSRASIKICDVNYGNIGQKATSLVLPCLLKSGLQSPVSEVRAIGLSTILKISKNAGPLLKPHIPVLVTALLEAISGLEPQVMNYLSLQVSSNVEIQNRLDSARIAASKMSPMMETVNLCVQYIDEEVLTELVPRLTELIKSGIGVGTKASCSNFVVSLVHQCPKKLGSHAGKLMGAFLHGVADRNSAVRKAYASALGHLVRISKDSSVEKLITRMKSWYLEKEEEAAHEGCGLTLHAISQQSPDTLRRHATLAMPLAFLAMHEKKEEKSKVRDEISIWEEVWLEITPGTEGGIKLYLPEIVELLRETLQSQSWTTKAQAAAAMSTVADKLGSNLGPPHLGNLMSALLVGLQGRTWAGKEALLHALQVVCTSCRDSLKERENDPDSFLPKVVEALLRESKKETLTYKLEALKCLGEVLETFSVDKFSEVFSILSPVLVKEEKMEVDGEEEEISSELKQMQFVSYITVLGQAWPENITTQEDHCEKIGCLLCDLIKGNTWKIQEAILKTLNKFLTRWHFLNNAETFGTKEATTVMILEKILTAISPCLGNLKYTVIRSEALNVVDIILTKLQAHEKLSALSTTVTSRLCEDLVAMSRDSSPELQDKSSELGKLLPQLESS